MLQPSICCHLLYILTQPEDVVPWRVETLKIYLLTQESSAHVRAVLKYVSLKLFLYFLFRSLKNSPQTSVRKGMGLWISFTKI